LVRLSKYLSMCGVTSRRGAEVLITQKRVTLNDIAVEKVGILVDETSDIVKVDGTTVTPVTEKVYIVLNKPRYVMTTLHDPFKRRTVCYYLRNLKNRVYPIGRLDFDTEGALLLCNDGDLTFRLSHPKYQVEKIYEAIVDGRFSRKDSMVIRGGVRLEDGAMGRAQVDILGYGRKVTHLKLTLTEGRKREVKQLCKSVGHPVKKLRRVAFAGITVKDLPTGAWRHLDKVEISRLKSLVGL